MEMHASGDCGEIAHMPIHSTPKSANTKRRSGDFGAGDYDESLIVEEMKKLCNEDNDLDDKSKEESVKTDSTEPSVEEYKKMLASDSYWSSRLRAQRRVAKRRTMVSAKEDARVRRVLSDDPSFSQ